MGRDPELITDSKVAEKADQDRESAVTAGHDLAVAQIDRDRTCANESLRRQALPSQVEVRDLRRRLVAAER